MFGDQFAGLRVILHHVGEGCVPAAQGEVDRRLVGLAHEVGQVVAGAQPGQDAIAVPAPRDYFLVDDAMGGQVPAVLGGIGGDALEQAMVIPTEREQDITWAFHVGTGKGQLTELGGVTKNGTDRLPSRSAGT